MPNIEIDYSPLSYQEKFHSSNYRFKIVVGGRRVGKSLCALHEALAKALSKPRSLIWWVSPTLTDSREVGWDMLKQYMDTLKPAISYVNETRMMIGFVNGSKILFKSGEKERSLRGRGLDHVVMDEAAFIDPDIWKRALRPALSDKKGTASIVSTANGRNWFWEKWFEAKEEIGRNRGRMTWEYFRWPTSINTFISPEEIELARNDLSDIDFRQEYLAEFVTRAGLVYSDFSDQNIIDGFKVEDYHDFFIGADFGYANPSALCFMAVDNRTGYVYQFDEVYESRTSISDLADLIDLKLEQWGIPRSRVRAIYTDPAGNAEELTSGISPVDYLRMEREWEVVNKGTLIVYGLHLVRSYIKAADGSVRFFVNKICHNTIRSLRGYTYERYFKSDMVKEEPQKDGIHDHMCDAIRYFFVNRFDKAKWVTNKVDNQNYLSSNRLPPPVIKKCASCNMPFSSRSKKDSPPFLCNKCKENI